MYIKIFLNICYYIENMITSGLSSNEIYCLQLKGLTPNDLVIGNSVYALGVLGGLRSGMLDGE